MADVVVGVANDGVEVALVFTEHGVAVAVGIRVSGAIGIDDQVVVGDQHHPHAEFAFVDPVDAVHGGDLTAEAVEHRAAEHGGVFAGRRQRQTIGAQAAARRDVHHVVLAQQVGNALDFLAGDTASEGRALLAIVTLVEHHVGADVAGLVRLDVGGVRVGNHLCTEAADGQVEANGRSRVVNALAQVSLEHRVALGEAGLHDGRLNNAEATIAAFGQRQFQLERAIRRCDIALQWRRLQQRGHAGVVERHRAAHFRHDESCASGGNARRIRVAPEVGCGGNRRNQTHPQPCKKGAQIQIHGGTIPRGKRADDSLGDGHFEQANAVIRKRCCTQLLPGFSLADRRWRPAKVDAAVPVAICRRRTRPK